MSAPRVILASLLFFCQKLTKLVGIRRNSVKKKYAQSFLRHGALLLLDLFNGLFS